MTYLNFSYLSNDPFPSVCTVSHHNFGKKSHNFCDHFSMLRAGGRGPRSRPLGLCCYSESQLLPWKGCLMSP